MPELRGTPQFLNIITTPKKKNKKKKRKNRQTTKEYPKTNTGRRGCENFLAEKKQNKTKQNKKTGSSPQVPIKVNQTHRRKALTISLLCPLLLFFSF